MRISPVDHIFVGEQGYAIEFLFFYREKLSLRKLKSSLRKALRKFFPLQHTFVDHDGTYYLEDPFPVEMEYLDRSSEELPKHDDLERLEAHYLFIQSTPGMPLFRAQLCHYKNGSTLAVNISHCLVDGFSYFMFMGYWAKLCQTPWTRFSERLKLGLFHPQFDRERLTPNESVHGVTHDDLKEHCGMFFEQKRDFGTFTQNVFDFVRFPKSEIKKELSELNAKSDVRLSSHDLLCVKLVREYAQKWNQKGDRLFVSSAFDYRRVFKEIGKFYFGNAVLATFAEIDFEDLYALETAEVAKIFRSAVASVDLKKVKDSLKHIESFRLQQGVGVLEHLHVAHPERGFLITNLSRMPISTLDFGWGAPHQVVPMTAGPRVMAIMSDGDDYVVRVSPESV